MVKMSKSKRDKQVVMELNIARINLLITTPLRFRIEWVRGNNTKLIHLDHRCQQSTNQDLLDRANIINYETVAIRNNDQRTVRNLDLHLLF